ncbi:hypothetical protein F3B05_26085, partial [Salmonella enterica subsp. enterica serovar Typhi]|nr:hypothetical protein [Salmonella enterica subsp. enterica serovar Typhi]
MNKKKSRQLIGLTTFIYTSKMEEQEMNSVNPVVVQFFYRSAIANLPEKKREIYQYIESKEVELEEMAINEKQFMEL